MPWWETVITGWLTVGVPALFLFGWKRGIRPMMIAIGDLLESTKAIASHAQRLETIERRLDQIERNTHP